MAKTASLLPAIFLLVFLQMACYEKQEGCLDIRAVNFDFSADIPCSDCCTYPELSLKPEHRLVYPDTVLVFRYDSLYATVSHPGTGFRIHRLRYFLSGLRLSGPGGAGGVTDSVTLYLPQGPGDTSTFQVIDDFMLADRSFLQATTLGTWQGEGIFDQLTFTIGIDPGIRHADPEKMPAGHPLSAPADGLNWEEGTGYISNYMAYSLANQPQDTIQVAMTTAVPISVALDPPLEIPPGYNIQLNFYFNYLAWWEGLDLSTATPQQIEQHFANQAPGSLFSVEVLLK